MIVRLNDNTEFEYKWCGVACTGDLVIAIENATVTDIVSAALDSSKMSTLTFFPDSTSEDISKTKTGYTRFVGVRIDESDNTKHLTMGKEYAS